MSCAIAILLPSLRSAVRRVLQTPDVLLSARFASSEPAASLVRPPRAPLRSVWAETSSSRKTISIRRRRRDTLMLPRGFVDDRAVGWRRDRVTLGAGGLQPG